MKLRMYWLLVLVLAVGMILSACGGEESTEEAVEEPMAETVAEPTEEPEPEPEPTEPPAEEALSKSKSRQKNQRWPKRSFPPAKKIWTPPTAPCWLRW